MSLMGRPPGSKNKTEEEILIQSWKPLKWKPVYDIMVSLFIAGHTYIEIAEIVEYTPTQVGNILRSPEATEVRNKVSAKIQNNTLNETADRIKRMTEIALNNAEAIITSEEFKEKVPFKQAEFSMGFLKGIGYLRPDNITENKVTNNTLVLDSAQTSELVSVLKESNDIQRRAITDGSKK